VTSLSWLMPERQVIRTHKDAEQAWAHFGGHLFLRALSDGYGHAFSEGRIVGGFSSLQEYLDARVALTERYGDRGSREQIVAEARVPIGFELFLAIRWLPIVDTFGLVLAPGGAFFNDQMGAVGRKVLPTPPAVDAIRGALKGITRAMNLPITLTDERLESVADEFAAFAQGVTPHMVESDVIELSPIVVGRTSTWVVDLKIHARNDRETK
jgi:hypothetical protein